MRHIIFDSSVPAPMSGRMKYFNGITPSWDAGKRLQAVAIMLGYESWEQFMSNNRKSHIQFVCDQDLADDLERQSRWLEMARNVSTKMGYLLPDALDLVMQVRPLTDPDRESNVNYFPTKLFEKALLEDDDIWWVSQTEAGHPFAPPGFDVGRAIRVCDCAKARLDTSIDILRGPELYILISARNNGEFIHTHFRRGDFVEIKPIPLADAIRGPVKNAKYLKEFFDRYYPSNSAEQNKAILKQWKDDLKFLHIAAGAIANSKRRWVQMSLVCRLSQGKPWFWPLHLTGTDDVIEKTRQQAIQLNNELGFVKISDD